MSYLNCEECDKQYELEEGKSSFSYSKCECGGKLKYSDVTPNVKPNNFKPGNLNISLKGIIVGFVFLFISLTISALALFGNNLPNDYMNIPTKNLTIFTIGTVILTIFSGSISAYIGKSENYLDNIVNGGLIGVILGLITGLIGGVLVLIVAVFFFGSLSMLGGIFNYIYKHRNIGLKKV